MILRNEFVFAIIFLAGTVFGRPYFLLKNKAPKCFQIEAPSYTTLTIKYLTPDLVVIDDEESPEIGEAERKIEEGEDTMYNERMQKRMETLKRAQLKDINISVTPRDQTGSMIASSPRGGNVASNNFPIKRREQIETTEGSFDYETGQLDGYIEICIQSYTATSDRPSRISIHVDYQSEEDSIVPNSAGLGLPSDKEREILEKENIKIQKENEIIKEETSRITSELMRMQRRAKNIAGDAQFSKSREESFHNQSINLHRAVKYWPMIRITALLIGGYLQVTHVVNYMKSRHIY